MDADKIANLTQHPKSLGTADYRSTVVIAELQKNTPEMAFWFSTEAWQAL